MKYTIIVRHPKHTYVSGIIEVSNDDFEALEKAIQQAVSPDATYFSFDSRDGEKYFFPRGVLQNCVIELIPNVDE